MILFVILCGICDGFILNGNLSSVPCPALCRCSVNILDCTGRQLSALPDFNYSHQVLNVHLDNNRITQLPSSSFIFSTTSEIRVLRLDSNPIESIDDNAFAGLENSLTFLGLADTGLTRLPNALKNLTKLTHLYLRDNRLSTLPDIIMDSFSTSLTFLDIKNNSFKYWPDSLRHLEFLDHLYLENNMIHQIPTNAFHGFENSLKFLFLSKNNLSEVSEAFRELTNLQTLVLNFNPLGNEGFHGGIFDSIKQSLINLSINNVGITRIPDPIKFLPNIKSLNMADNALQYIPVEDVAHIAGIKYLTLERCGLTRVPSAIQLMKNLTILRMDGNYIRTLEKGDLDGLTYLTDLSITNSSLMYISPGVFSETPTLSSIILSQNILHGIPDSLNELKANSVQIYLDGNAVECSCHLKWLLSQNTTFTLVGRCENHNMDIQNYYTNVLPICAKPWNGYPHDNL